MPYPVAIWISARGWLSRRESSSLVIASNWARRSRPGCSSSSGMSGTRDHKLPRRWCTWSAIWSSSVAGRWNQKTRRAVGSGSIRQVNQVSLPVDSYPNGRRPSMRHDGWASGMLAWYLTVCHSTPESVVPYFFASITPIAWRSTKST